MLEPKKDSPSWLLSVYPFLFLLRYDRSAFFRIVTGRLRFHWHYDWESQLARDDSDNCDGWYKPGTMIMPE